MYALVLFATPILLIVWLNEYVQWFNKPYITRSAKAYAGMSVIRHLGNAWIRFMMGFVTAVVVQKWSSEQENLKKINDFKTLIENYKSTGKVTSALSNIFREWFICQWIIFSIGIVEMGTLFLKSILNEEYKDEPHRLWYISSHLLFEIIAFMIPFFLGIFHNIYHEKYYEQLKEQQEEILKDTDNKIFMYADLIPKNPKFEFIPSLFVLQIPLDSAGYMLTFLIAIKFFSFIATFLVTFADVNKI